MRFLFTLSCLMLSMNAVLSQRIVSFDRISFKNDQAYFNGELFTGKVIDKRFKQNRMLEYKDGSLHGFIKRGNEVLNYDMGYVIGYKILDSENKSIYSFNLPYSTIMAKDISFGVNFKGQRNDSLLFSTVSKSINTLSFQTGIVVKYENNTISFSKVKELKLMECVVEGCQGGLNIHEKLTESTLRYNIISHFDFVYFTLFKIRTIDGKLIPLNEASNRVCFIKD